MSGNNTTMQHFSLNFESKGVFLDVFCSSPLLTLILLWNTVHAASHKRNLSQVLARKFRFLALSGTFFKIDLTRTQIIQPKQSDFGLIDEIFADIFRVIF